MKGHSLRYVWELRNSMGTFLAGVKNYLRNLGVFFTIPTLHSTDILYEEKRSVFHGRTFVSAFCPPRYKDWSQWHWIHSINSLQDKHRKKNTTPGREKRFVKQSTGWAGQISLAEHKAITTSWVHNIFPSSNRAHEVILLLYFSWFESYQLKTDTLTARLSYQT